MQQTVLADCRSRWVQMLARLQCAEPNGTSPLLTLLHVDTCIISKRASRVVPMHTGPRLRKAERCHTRAVLPSKVAWDLNCAVPSNWIGHMSKLVFRCAPPIDSPPCADLASAWLLQLRNAYWCPSAIRMDATAEKYLLEHIYSLPEWLPESFLLFCSEDFCTCLLGEELEILWLHQYSSGIAALRNITRDTTP